MRPTASNWRRARRAGAALCVVMALLGSSCAYFNTFYNAKSQFKRGEDERTKRAGASSGADAYQKCIDKCQLLLRYYPKSKYADDALFLIGMSRLHRSEYVQSRAALEEMTQRFPDSEYVERAYYNMGLAALRQGDAAGAAQAFEQLSTKFPESKLSVEAVFRTAEARLDVHDYDQARSDLKKFIAEHPNSPLSAEAQLRVARTYYEEHRFEEARDEYQRALDMKMSSEVRYEAQLNVALSRRALAAQVLSDPSLDAVRRARYLAARNADGTVRTRPVKPAPKDPPGGTPAGGDPPGMERGGVPQLPGSVPGDSLPFEPRVEGEALPDSILASARPSPDDDVESSRPRDPAMSEGDATRSVDSATPADSAAARLDRSATPPDSLATVDAAAESLPRAAQRDSVILPPPVVPVLTAEEQKQLEAAERELEDVQNQLAGLRKAAARLGLQADLDIELAVTRALRGEPDGAIDDLDQLARANPNTEIAARSRYEIAEIHRRLGDLEAARTAYEDALKEKRDGQTATLAQRKSGAIVNRVSAGERLREAPRTLARWKEIQAQPDDFAALADSGARGDSLGERIAVETAYEELASQQLRIAEIDLLELDQPLMALREFERVIADYPGSLQSPRAAFGIAWIYDHRLRDPERAKQAYEVVVRDYAESPQGQEAREILANWTGIRREGTPSSSRP